MDFFKGKKFRKGNKPNAEKSTDEKPVPQPEEPKSEHGSGDGLTKSPNADPINDAEEDDDDDFITNEVKRRLKELRRNSFMVLIPEEESCAEEEEEDGEEAGETTSTDWRDVEAEGRQWWGGFDVFYERYCERMLFFDRMSAQQLTGAGSTAPLTPSPRSASKKLTSPLRCLSLKKIEEPDDETEKLQQMENETYQDIETTYVAHICLTWEALHCQFTQLSQKISCQPENPACYNHSAQLLQQFQVLLQRFIENEPFEQGLRPESYARARKILPKLLQVPNIRASEPKDMEEGSELRMLGTDLMKILENSILTFHLFLKMDKKRPGNGLHFFGNHNHAAATPLQQVQSSLVKKATKLKELKKKRKGWKKKSWPQAYEDVQLFFGLIDVKILSRALRMERITKEQLFWCEEKMKKLDVLSSDHGKLLQRDPSPVLFPC
ncbi:uncharacterized protein LOC116204590 [Punica granatum]|uniref:Uncharacterized protein LOC116204590 n=2 Tax=Punica granatum TaxID=22663 RepID=A0A6P8DH45_PUNGR|nr:uncharacterized protein LOC116204590 [Punica granatum]XP_031392607.1 uncharacterized protein LOC116204590 [Punica granatum]PKI75781.1 hypothetical protein CRG98_003824 [Punica granatum]